jgi:hypothetical protein
METVLLYFEYAYTQRYSQKDSLIVNISSDCGTTWTRVYANGPDGEGIFETAESSDEFFIPMSSTDWCGSGYGAECPVIDLSNWAGMADIKIQFETFNNYGNNLYLNNVEVGTTVGLFDGFTKKEGFRIYPNPASGRVTVESPNNTDIQILDLQGKIVRSVKTESSYTSIDIRSLNSGIYIIRISDKNNILTEKLIVQ